MHAKPRTWGEMAEELTRAGRRVGEVALALEREGLPMRFGLRIAERTLVRVRREVARAEGREA